MGTGIILKCSNCSFKKDYFIGVGMAFPRVYDNLVKSIINYDYGDEWAEFFQLHPGAAVDASKELYHCRLCNTICVDYNLDLYIKNDDTPPDEKYVALWADFDKEYKLVKHYVHWCPNCDGRMKKKEHA